MMIEHWWYFNILYYNIIYVTLFQHNRFYLLNSKHFRPTKKSVLHSNKKFLNFILPINTIISYFPLEVMIEAQLKPHFKSKIRIYK